jgi:membrane-associated phospholipid phosphatase
MRWSVVFVAATLQTSSLALATRATAQNSSATKTLGDIGQVALPVGASVIALAHHDRKGIGELALVSATTLIVVHTLKPIINERRPNGGSRSFPSGHTASAFMGAAFLQQRYGWAYGAPAYAAAAFVGYSRVHAKEHWTKDVVAGAALGVASNLVLTRRYRRLQLSPTVARSGLGVSALVVW